MATATSPKPMTAAEFLALPEDGTDRELIRGELRVYPRVYPIMTVRNFSHTFVATKIARYLDEWLDTQPIPYGAINTGEIGFHLPTDPETLVGIDVAYTSAEVLASRTPDTTLFDGIPTLAVEILSPSDTILAIQRENRSLSEC